MRNVSRLGTALMIGAAMVACNKGDKANGDSAMANGAGGSAAAVTAPPTGDSLSASQNASPVPTSTEKMTDPEIVSIAQAADDGEIATSQIAEKKASNPDVIKYAAEMVKDHTKMIADRSALIKAQSITPSKPANDSSAAMGKKMVDALNAMPKGAAFDTAYVNGQAMAHQATLTMLQRAQGQATNAALKDAIGKAIPAVQKHLDDVKGLQTKLAGAK